MGGAALVAAYCAGYVTPAGVGMDDWGGGVGLGVGAFGTGADGWDA